MVVYFCSERCRQQKELEAAGRHQTVVTVTVGVPSTVKPSSTTSPSGKSLEAHVISPVQDEQNVTELRTEGSLTVVGNAINNSKDEPLAIDHDGVTDDSKEMAARPSRNNESDEVHVPPCTQSAVVLDPSCLNKPLQIEITAFDATSEPAAKTNSMGISPAVTITFSTRGSSGDDAVSPSTDNGIADSSSVVSLNGTSDTLGSDHSNECQVDETCNSSTSER